MELRATSGRTRLAGSMTITAVVLATFAPVLYSQPREATDDRTPLREGDLVFHESRSPQARTIREVTGSRYTHVGVVFFRNGRWEVLEAVSPVRYTAYDEWTARGRGGHVAIRRLRGADRILDRAALVRLRAEGERHLGKPYDVRFAWGDDAMYCSELVFKTYENALGIRIGAPQPWSDFDLSGPGARDLVERRLGGRHPWGRVITPVRMLESEALAPVP
jgi:hypothetical protein